MAENEALDLDFAYARRWKPIFEAALAGDPVEETAPRARKAFLNLIHKTIKSFAGRGLLIADFLDQRHSPRELRKLVSRCSDQSFGELLASVLNHNPNATKTECVYHWIRALFDRAIVAERRARGFQWARLLDRAPLLVG